MRTNLKNILFYVAASLLMATLAITRFGQNIEDKFGLPLHYKIRGELNPPEKIFILTPYKTTKLGQKTLLRDWDRTRHSEVINKLTQLEAGQVAIDIFFREYQNAKSDSKLAMSIQTNKKVILGQFASATQSATGSYVLIRNPIKQFSSSAATLAPALLDDTKHRKDSFYPFYSVIHSKEFHPCFGYPVDADLPDGVLVDYGKNLYYPRISTLPIALLEQRIIENKSINEIFLESIKASQLTSDSKLCQLSRVLREHLLNQPELLEKISQDNSLSTELASWINSLVLLNEHLEDLNDKPRLYLNLYGLPQTIQTLTYEEFDQYFQINQKSLENNKFKDATVFLGGSFVTSDEEKQDNFETAFTKNNQKMSGVELTATAFSNLLTNSYLRKYSNYTLFLTSFLGSILVFALSLMRKDFLITLSVCIVGLVYLLSAKHLFVAKNIWLPIIVPISILFFSLLMLLTQRFKATKQQKASLQSYIPETALRNIESAKDGAPKRRLTTGVCMVTDVQDFTKISESLNPEIMADLISEYFSILTDCIKQSGGEIYLIDGDSLTAVWTGEEVHICNKSALAALMILERIEEFNQKHNATPFYTRIGMDYGEIALGNIGNKSHSTYAVVGDTVYTASRLEQHNKETNTQLLITQNIEKNLVNSQTRDLGGIRFKGKNKLTRVYELIELDSDELSHQSTTSNRLINSLIFWK